MPPGRGSRCLMTTQEDRDPMPRSAQRLAEDRRGEDAPWTALGPVPQRAPVGHGARGLQPDGTAWDYFPHDHARSRAYRWGEDGIAGISDDRQQLCLALALWNGQDPILKERLFGLTNGEGNHGEDVKELLLLSRRHADPLLPEDASTSIRSARSPTPGWSRRTAGAAGSEPEFELLDTGVFDDDRYFDVFVEYAKAAPDDMLMRITVHNRGPDAATICTCCRSSGSATPGRGSNGARPGLEPRRWRRSWRITRPSARTACHVDGEPDAPVHRERDQRAHGCSARRALPARSRTPSTSI